MSGFALSGQPLRPTVYLCHGFNVLSPERFFRIGGVFESAGYPVVRVDYGWTGPISVRWATERTAQRLADNMRPHSIVLGHSNGAAIAYRAHQLGAPVQHLVLINPALHRRTVFRMRGNEGSILDRVHVYYARDDRVVTAGKWLRRLSPLRLLGRETSWGEMGRVGALVPQRGVYNHDLATVLNTRDRIGHSGAIRWDRLDTLGTHIFWQIAIGRLDGRCPIPQQPPGALA
jgi:hypothetical protein